MLGNKSVCSVFIIIPQESRRDLKVLGKYSAMDQAIYPSADFSKLKGEAVSERLRPQGWVTGRTVFLKALLQAFLRYPSGFAGLGPLYEPQNKATSCENLSQNSWPSRLPFRVS